MREQVTAADLGLVCLFHTGLMGNGAGVRGGLGFKLKYTAPIPYLDDIAADFPDLTLISAHPGWPWQEEQLAMARHKGNVYIDLSGWAPKYFPPQLVQYAIQKHNGDSKVFVLEVNPRASRTVPYVSKATGVPLAKIASRLMTGRKLREFLPEFIERRADLDTGSWYYVKSPVFPWNKFPGVDTVLGPEMKSTGEVMGVADNFGEAFAKAQLAAGQKLPTQGAVFISVTDSDKRHVAVVARKFVDMGFKLVATSGTADVLETAGMHVERVYKVKEGRPNVVDFIKGQRIQLVINTPTGQEPWFDEKAIRRAAVMARIPTITTLAAARAAAEGIAALQRGEIKVRALQQLHADRAVGVRRLAG